MFDEPAATPPKLPDAPALVADHRRAVLVTADGEVEELRLAEAAARAADTPPILCHVKSTAAKLGTAAFPAFDLLELFCFVRPAQFCLPTPRGLAEALDLPPARSLEEQAETLFHVAARLLAELLPAPAGAEAIAWAMDRGGWSWGPAVMAALGAGGDKARRNNPLEGLRVWRGLGEWSEHAPPPQPGHLPVTAAEAEDRLRHLLGTGAEERPQQVEYARGVSAAFAPADEQGHPRAVIAQAGTGVGKTLGYLAPASVWADKNGGTVWISTYTRNLQRQLDGELDRLYPDRHDKALKAVVRKGRENYLCLLNYEDALGRLTARAGDAVALGLAARWIGATRDGDMVGGDFPSWLADLLGFPTALGLTDRRGECIYSACSHYSKCFIERTVRRARRARVVVANHALVMIQAALGGGEDAYRPARYVFDEGHHLFDAADTAFSAHLTGRETAELRRWLIGAEGRHGSRTRGLRNRLEGLVGDDEAAAEALDRLIESARALPGPGWTQRLAGGTPAGPAENFLALVRQQVYARDGNADSPYDLETETHPPVPGLLAAAGTLDDYLSAVIGPAQALSAAFARRLSDDADELDTATRQRLEALGRSLERRAISQITAWREMLRDLDAEPPAEFVDRMSVERMDGRDVDVGLHRNWVDPTVPFAELVAGPAEGLLVTSATMKDGPGDGEADWAAALSRSGVAHLPDAATRLDVASPFDYGEQTRVFIINDVNKNDADQAAAAFRELMLAAGGGAIALFTSIARLRAVHKRLVAAPDLAGLNLLAQHVDPVDVGTLIDIFRAEEDACLLGTDAVRDGIDVPGRALRLVIYDRVPWPRPDILHKARKKAFESASAVGGRPQSYDDVMTRLRLKQAYGRLIRQSGDRGVFVILDRALPSRLTTAFPPGVEPRRLGLADTLSEVRRFLDR